MSHHHMTLPPITYTPLPKTKPAERRTNAGRILKRGSVFAPKDAEETEDSDEIQASSRQINPIAGRSGRNDSSDDEDAPKHKPQSTATLLSDGTLRTLLLLQEQAGNSETDRIEL